MSQKSSTGGRTTLERAIETARKSGVVRMDTTVGELLDQVQELERSGDLEAAKVKNGGVLVTKCFAFVTGCE